MNPSATTVPRQRGLTLIETCIVLATVAIVLGTALPSFQQAREVRHLEGVAAQLRTDFAHARTVAVARNENIRIGFGATCYVVHTGSAGDCSCSDDGRTQCTADAKLLRHVAVEGVSLSSNSASMLLDASLGTVTPTGTVKVLGRDGRAIHLVVSIMGRVRDCSPAPPLPGHPAC